MLTVYMVYVLSSICSLSTYLCLCSECVFLTDLIDITLSISAFWLEYTNQLTFPELWKWLHLSYYFIVFLFILCLLLFISFLLLFIIIIIRMVFNVPFKFTYLLSAYMSLYYLLLVAVGITTCLYLTIQSYLHAISHKI